MPNIDEPSTKPMSQKLGGKPGLKMCAIGETSQSKLGPQLLTSVGEARRFSAFKDLEAFQRWRLEPSPRGISSRHRHGRASSR